MGSKRKFHQIESDAKTPESKVVEDTQANFETKDGVQLEVMRWGMISPNLSTPVINCRFDDVLRTPMFRDLLKDFRCIITINGYYEWKVNDKDKQPYFLYPKQGEYLHLAGFFKPQPQDDGTIVNTFVICTLEALDTLSFIHHRMPLILTEEMQKIWLDPTLDFKKVYQKIYAEKPTDMLSYYRVASVVNSIKNDNEDCIMQLEKYKKKLHSRGLGRFFKTSTKTEETKAGSKQAAEKKLVSKDTQGRPEDTQGDKITAMNTNITQMTQKDSLTKFSKPSECIPKEDEGIPLRLHKGKYAPKSEKFMSSQQIENKQKRSK